MTAQDFINANPNNPRLKSPHGILGQCVSVPNLFAVENGWAELFGAGDDTALHIWQNGVVGYQKITNIPGPNGNAPVPGDFVFFSYNHVALVQAANLNTVFTFEQNDPVGSGAHLKAYSYSNVLGWFHHPANAPVSTGGTATVLRPTNVRASASTAAPVTSSLGAGATFGYTGTVIGQSVTENGITSNLWIHSNLGHFVWAGNCKL